MSLYPSCWDLFDRPATCPGCGGTFPRWTRVRLDGITVLTHDGDLICPGDRTFGMLAGPAPLASVEPTAVAA